MSLLQYAMEDCVIMDRITTPDGMGGYTPTWREGAPISAAIVKNDSMESLQAQAMGVSAVYTITTSRAISLQYHDVIKRLSDGKILRVKSDGKDSATPMTTQLDMRTVRAEEWDLVQ